MARARVSSRSSGSLRLFFPLGNSAGRPFDRESQALTLELALRVLETAPAAHTTVQSPLRWSDLNLDRMTPEQIAEHRLEYEEIKAIAKAQREAGAGATRPPR